MLLTLLFGLSGATLGALRAKRLGGTPADMAQYGAGFAIFFALVGMILAVILARMLA